MAEHCNHRDQSRSKVSSTAHLVAYVRGMEAEVHGEKKLFDDPYACALAGEVGERSLKIADEGDTWTPAQKKRFLNSISIRTRTIDDYVLSCLEEHNVEQIVVLGAGLDTRPWRLHPATAESEKITYIEVDFQELFDYKLAIMKDLKVSPNPHFNYHSVVVDLTIADVWVDQLKQEGFLPNRRTLWLMEGFCNYFTEEELRQVMATITANSASGSHIIATMVTIPATHFYISMHRFWPETALPFFQSCGPWQGREDDVEDLAVALDRVTPPGEERRGYFILRLSLP